MERTKVFVGAEVETALKEIHETQHITIGRFSYMVNKVEFDTYHDKETNIQLKILTVTYGALIAW